MMKKILFYLGFVLLFASCDPEDSLVYKINNSSANDIEIAFVGSTDVLETINVSNNVIQTWKVDTDMGSPSKMDLNVLYDSIVVSVNNSPVIIYKPEKSGKNIYSYEYWIENKKGKKDYEYIFIIKEEDIAN